MNRAGRIAFLGACIGYALVLLYVWHFYPPASLR